NVYDTSQFNTSGVVAPPFVREVLSDKETHILWTAIREVTDGLLEDLYKELPSLDRTGLLSLAQLLDIWHIFGQEGIYRICARAMLGFYSYGGWPDLTLHRDGKIRFVEVKKGSDKLNRNQSYWVRNFALPLDWDVVVLNVVVPK
ncbi:MAG TPA: VRR-NUC domain-containing protein, partial [Candidatus Hodarchaeales archaeon]|nr:VRR-NUC domain-containing protein [Candidatus Hodarchaeales archaeon]